MGKYRHILIFQYSVLNFEIDCSKNLLQLT